ncbi:MAG TPA: LPS assembly protein LptD [Opitutaceae bacterium]
MIRRLTLALALSAAWSLHAQTAPATTPDITSDKQEILQATGEARLTGNARLTDGTLLLLADEMIYNRGSNTITATGHIVYTRGDIRLLADRFVYDRTKETFTADNIRVGRYPYFIEGFSASGSRKEITIQRARASYGEPGPWQPTLSAATIVFSPDTQEIKSQDVMLGIGHTQPIPIPRFNHRFAAPALFAADSLSAGYRRSLGVFAEGSLLAPVAPGLRLGADIGVYTDRGVMVGPSGRYFNEKDPEKLSGFFRSGYINDHGDKGFDNVFGKAVPEERAYAEWQHRQQLTPDLTLTASANWWKDPEVYRDFRSRSFYRVQEPDTFVEAVYTGQNYFLSAFARPQPNRFHRVQERLPEVRFDLLPTPLGQGFIHRFNASAAMLREDPIYPRIRWPWDPFLLDLVEMAGASSLTSSTDYFGQFSTTRLDAYYGVERPIPVRDWLTITPVAGGRVTHYTNSKIGGTDLSDYTRGLGEIGADAVLRLSGTFDYKNPRWKIDGLRHLFTPRVSYRYIPDADKGRNRLPQIDRRARIARYPEFPAAVPYDDEAYNYLPYLQPLGLGDIRSVDDLRATNTLRLSLDNVLQTREPKGGSRDLVALNVGTDFRFRRTAREKNISETHVEVALTPASWLQFDAYQSFAEKSFDTQEFNSGVTIRDGRAWSLRFSNNFLRDQIEDYMVEGRRRINERLEALTRLRYDVRTRRFTEQSYGVVQNLGNTWLVSYTVSVYEGRARESSFGFNVQIDTVRF